MGVVEPVVHNEGFVDIHSHILWGTDDGSQTFETSVEMLRLAAASGTSDIVATPHSDLRFSFDADEIERKILLLQMADGNVPRIHRGCDFHLHLDNIQDCLVNPRKFTVNHLRYLLVEFAENNIAKNTTNVLEQMMEADITPIITHPERNLVLQKQPELLAEWIRCGCLVQVTGQSFLGRFGKQAKAAVDDLMERKMVHFVASDAHDPVYRQPVLRPAYDHIAENYGGDVARRLFIAHPQAVINGSRLQVDITDLDGAPRKWYQLW